MVIIDVLQVDAFLGAFDVIDKSSVNALFVTKTTIRGSIIYITQFIIKGKACFISLGVAQLDKCF